VGRHRLPQGSSTHLLLLFQGLQNPFIRKEVFEKQFAAERRRREAAAAKAMKGGGSVEDLHEMREAAQAIERFSRL
jgi:hypothetical protein